MDAADSGDGRFSIARRNVLKALGGSVVAVGALSGTASAHASQFFGCTQVCSDTDNSKAIVYVDGSYELRDLDKNDPDSYSERKNVPWAPYASACYELMDDEAAVVGVVHTLESEGRCEVCLNPNRCAQNYVDDRQDVMDDLSMYDLECGDFVWGTDCEVYTSNGSPAGGNSNGRNR